MQHAVRHMFVGLVMGMCSTDFQMSEWNKIVFKGRKVTLSAAKCCTMAFYSYVLY